MTVSTGIITTIAGSGGNGSYSGDNGLATSAALDSPRGVSVDATGNYLHRNYIRQHLNFLLLLGNVYIADYGNHRIRKVTVSTGIITTIAGTGIPSYSGDNGAATSATLSYPRGVSLDSTGSF